MGSLSGVNGIIIIMFGVVLLLGAIVWVVISSKVKKTELSDEKKEKSTSVQKNAKVENPYKKNPNANVNKDDIFNFMNFDRIEDNMIIQDNGKKYNAIIKCKGINYNLMSEVEQLAVEEGFITFLNTLKGPIQLYVQANNINLKDSIAKYVDNMRELENEYEDLSAEYTMLVNSLEATDEQIAEVEEKRSSIQNVLEYGHDIVRYVERLAMNKAMLQRNFYIVVSYYSSELTLGSEFKKEEIADMCYTELFTRVQNIQSGLLACSVSSEILNSNELAELLYSAYNRDDENYINVRQALESGFHRLYSTSEDAIQKKHDRLIETMRAEAEYKAVEALAKAVEEGTYVSPQVAESAYEQEVSRQAIELIKNERVDESIKKKAKNIIVEEYKENERKRIKSIKEEQQRILNDGKAAEENHDKKSIEDNEDVVSEKEEAIIENNTDDETIV